MSLPIIVAAETQTNEPQEVVTFDKWWIEHLMVNGGQDGKITALVILSKFGTKSDGTMLFNGEKYTITINDVLAESEANPTLGAALVGIIQYVGEKSVQEGIANSNNL